MARRFRRYAGRARGYAGRAYRASNRSFGGKMGLNISPAFLAGMAIGFTDMDERIPAQAVLGAATVPIRGAGMLKGVAQGIIFGNLVQQLKNGGASASGFRGV